MGPGSTLTEPEHETEPALLTPLGAFMQRRNAELGLSIAGVARRAGMSRATWYRLARGECASPGVRLLRALARVYRVRAAEILALAAEVDVHPSPHPATGPVPAREAGDALWRCRYERHARPGAWIDVQVDLFNLSDRAWLDAEVQGIHGQWWPIGDGASHSAGPMPGTQEPVPCRVALAPTGPGEWVRAQTRLQAPLVAGPAVYCLALCCGPAMHPVGAATCLLIEVT
jgi:transcriptional regulator with XRE-family HTH domain